MLSRVADSLYWMSRFLERAENTARLIDVNLQLVLDLENMDDTRVKEQWEPIIRSLADDVLFYKLHPQADSRTVGDFLTFSDDNPNSVLSCLFSARENMRMVRDQITAEMWEVINRLYLFLKSDRARASWAESPYDFYQEIINTSHHFRGLVDGTFSRKEAYYFMQVGRYLERSDKTTRILDLKYHLLLPSAQDVGGALDTVQWVAVLRSCTAMDAYRSAFVGDVRPERVIELLVLSEQFPRSVRYCLYMLDRYMRSISGSSQGHFANDSEKRCGRLLSDISYSNVEDILSEGLHEYLDGIQMKLNEIGECFYNTYLHMPQPDLSEEISEHRAQYQQQ